MLSPDFTSNFGAKITIGNNNASIFEITDKISITVIIIFRVDIDLTEKKLNSKSVDKRLSKDLAFENLVLSQLDDDDFTFLFKKQFAFKNQITEKANIDSIEGFFDYEAVEQEGLMYAYNDVLRSRFYGLSLFREGRK